MPSPYVKKVRPKKMSQYEEANLDKAVQECKDGNMSVRAAAAHYSVPKSTLHDRLKETHGKDHGRPTVLSSDEEDYLCEMVKQCADWGFPFTEKDLQKFVMVYLDKRGSITRFKDNMPTHMFMDRFIQRHPDLGLRKTNLIKRARASVSAEDIEQFFTRYEKVVAGVPPENILNYDETNLRDDPGSKKCLFKKGTKYCERVRNSSKQSISIMVCGSATGELLPVMVIYKAGNVYTSWCERGPKGTVYSCSKSGWFDEFQFENWFFEIALPKLNRKVGKTVLISDNLTSHISPAVIESCRKTNSKICFFFL